MAWLLTDMIDDIKPGIEFLGMCIDIWTLAVFARLAVVYVSHFLAVIMRLPEIRDLFWMDDYSEHNWYLWKEIRKDPCGEVMGVWSGGVGDPCGEVTGSLPWFSSDCSLACMLLRICMRMMSILVLLSWSICWAAWSIFLSCRKPKTPGYRYCYWTKYRLTTATATEC